MIKRISALCMSYAIQSNTGPRQNDQRQSTVLCVCGHTTAGKGGCWVNKGGQHGLSTEGLTQCSGTRHSRHQLHTGQRGRAPQAALPSDDRRRRCSSVASEKLNSSEPS